MDAHPFQADLGPSRSDLVAIKRNVALPLIPGDFKSFAESF